MDSLYVLIPVTVILLVVALAIYLWAVNSGQFDDLDKAAHSILFEDEDKPPTRPDTEQPTPATQDPTDAPHS